MVRQQVERCKQSSLALVLHKRKRPPKGRRQSFIEQMTKKIEIIQILLFVVGKILISELLFFGFLNRL